MQVIRGLCSTQEALPTQAFIIVAPRKREQLCPIMATKCFLLEAIPDTSFLFYGPRQINMATQGREVQWYYTSRERTRLSVQSLHEGTWAPLATKGC